MALEARSGVAAGQHSHRTRQRAEIVTKAGQGGAERCSIRSFERPRHQLVVRVLDQHRRGGAKQRHRVAGKVFLDHRLAFMSTPRGQCAGKSISSFPLVARADPTVFRTLFFQLAIYPAASMVVGNSGEAVP